MSNAINRSAKRADWDPVLVDMADYVCSYKLDSELAFETAHYCLMDTLAMQNLLVGLVLRTSACSNRAYSPAPGRTCRCACGFG